MQSGMVYNIQRMSTKDGPGLRTTVFLKGCPLRCPWCSNPESQLVAPQLLVFANLCTECGRCESVCPSHAITHEDGCFNRDVAKCTDCGACVDVCMSKARVMSGKMMTVQEVMAVVDRDNLFYENSEGGVTFGGGEPTMGGEFLLEMLQACRSHGYHTCLDTCGCCSTEFFAKTLPLTDLYFFDCKHMDPAEHKRLTGVDNVLILKNLDQVFKAGKDVHIRVPLMPGINDTEENIAAMASMLKGYGHMEVDILPCHAFGRSKYDALRREQPTMKAYQPDALKAVLARFEAYGLKTTIA